MLGNIALAASSSKSSGSSTTFLLIIVVLVVIFYFLMIRPQRNRARKVQEQQNSVQPGARVRTTAGMYATVVRVDGNDVVLEVAPGVQVTYLKRAIMEVLPDGTGDEAATTGEAYDEEAHEDAAEEPADGHAADETTSRSV